MTETAISIRNISKCYQVFNNQRSRLMRAIWPQYKTEIQEIWALKDINFEIKRGEAVAIIGRNGSGKSTLLEILTGTLTPTQGQVTVNGRVSALLELGSGFNPEYTGRENVILNGLLLGLSRQDIMSRFHEIEDFAEIGAAIERPAKTYSSGMMMRLAFAVQVLCDPDILIVDEALSVGDFFFQQKCLSYIQKLLSQGTTLLLVSHDMGTIRNICTRGILLDSGNLKFSGDALEAINHYLLIDKLNSDIQAVETQNHQIKKNTKNLNKNLKLQPLWEAKNIDESKSAQILRVYFLNSEETPCSSVRIGEEVIIRTLYASSSNKPIHVTLTIKNKYNQIITVLGSYTLKTPIPNVTKKGELLFQLKVLLNIEAGDYTLSINLGHPEGVSNGSVIDTTPWLGPFHVSWNYQTEIPAFYGMVGLPAHADFIHEI